MKTKAAAFTIRLATDEDIAILEQLIKDSVRVLQAPDYTVEQRETALRMVYGVDTQLIRDGAYFAVETEGKIVGCGGWSRRKTLYGGDHHASREDALLNPETDPARIRAFFVRPGAERRGIGSAILQASEAAAVAEGFKSFELRSTLTGVAFYRAHGYAEIDPIEVALTDGVILQVVRMAKAVVKTDSLRAEAHP
ncbi:MAG: GNAT family N-acetyltransferase [Candidatus Korobacteraceae bacterium]